MNDLDRLNTALAGQYVLTREIGQGGMATVFLAEDPKHDRKVAVKVLRDELSAAIGAERFEREIQIAAKLTHPHILALFDSGKVGGVLYYVMPYVDGPSLRERLRREGQLAIDEAIAITRAVATGLAYAHGRGVVHRDIKPDNVLFNAGEPVLADFGIARALDSAESERLTETGLSLGTPAYMSPEQAAGEKDVDARSDVYSLACVLYEMLAGQPPFAGHNARAILARHVTDPVPPVTTVRPSVGDGLSDALNKALHKVPADRFASAADFAAALADTPGARDLSAEKTLIVLPFTSGTSDAELVDFADGLTDDVTSAVSGIRTLRVVSRTTAARFKTSPLDARSIGRESNVRYLIEGGVRRTAGEWRVTARLVDAAEDVQLWSDRMRGALAASLDLQEDVAQRVAAAVRQRLAPAERPVVGGAKGSNLYAYECYLRARRDIWRFTENAVIQALSYVQEAVDLVGEDVLLYAAIAEAYFTFPHIGGKEPEACLESVQDCANRIFDLDRESPHGHYLLGLVYRKRDGDLLASASALRRAAVLTPDEPAILFWNGYYAAECGDRDLAETCAERLRQVDPQNPRSHFLVAWHHHMRGRFDRALESYQSAYAQDRTNPRVGFHYAVLLAMAEGWNEASKPIDAIVKDFPGHLCASLSKFVRFAAKGQRALALKILTPETKQAARWDGFLSMVVAAGLTHLAEFAMALEWLDNAVRRGFVNYPYLRSAEDFAPLREDPRGKELLGVVEGAWETVTQLDT